jgi:hypothetical protein
MASPQEHRQVVDRLRQEARREDEEWNTHRSVPPNAELTKQY